MMYRRWLLSINRYDFIVISFFLGCAFLFSSGYHTLHSPIEAIPPISLSWTQLFTYSLATTTRLLLGLIVSFIAALIMATVSAKSIHAARVILPLINIMESVPLIGFLAMTTAFFMWLYPNDRFGLELAAIFGVFTSQVWNMALSLYQSLRVVPQAFHEMATNYQITAFERYWRIEFPYAIPGLLWNTMVSQSAAWFALVATEAIPYQGHSINLPGIGTYIHKALTHSDIKALIGAMIALIANIIVFDQCLFRPLACWADKFRMTRTQPQQHPHSWFYNIFKRSSIIQMITRLKIKQMGFQAYGPKCKINMPSLRWLAITTWYMTITGIAVTVVWQMLPRLPSFSIDAMAWITLLTTLRVASALILGLVIFVPLGIVIGTDPKLRAWAQPVIQILAALPPNLFYPLFVVFIIYTHQPLSLWSIALIMLGSQWYILFNVVAGVASMPEEYQELTTNFQIPRWHYWRYVVIPAIFPHILTGVISAAGGAWNTVLMAEWLQWGHNHLQTQGLGAYITRATEQNHLAEAALGCFVMCVVVGLCIIFVWQPLYRLADRKFSLTK